ncbi:MAG: DNA polymerase I [Planctomycetaceae bacterium]|jgi:DNA polymerase-1|nr:DNA polymerase I [Planctomycetaceae bacterium]
MSVFVLDAHGLLYQLFHALPPMTSPQSEPVGAVYGFAKDLFSLLGQHQPKYLFCAFDLPGKTFRTDIYPAYKANRSKMPEDLRQQIGFVHELLDAFGIPQLSCAGYEADDVMASVARMAARRGLDCVVVTSDKDCRQLINNRVSLFNLRKQSFYRAEELLADWGIKPEQVADYQSLVGDPTDNVPGVPLIGAKLASELLVRFGTLENIFDHISEISGQKRQDTLRSNKALALLSRKLVTLNSRVPLEIGWTPYSGFDRATLRTLFQRFGFKSLLGKLEDNAPRAGGGFVHSVKTETSAGLCLPLPAHRSPLAAAVYHLIDTPEKFDGFYAQFKEQPVFAFDTETVPSAPQFDATSPRYTELAGLSFAWNETEAWYLPVRSPLGTPCLSLQNVLAALKPVLENPQVQKIGQNLKYDIIVLRNAGIRVRGAAFDTMLADYLLRSEMAHNLDDMAEHYLRHQTIRIENIIGSGKNQKRMDEVMTDTMAEYAGEDALVTWFLYKILKKQIESFPEWKELLYKIELPVMEILAEMEFTGITVDTALLKNLSGRFAEQMRTLENEIYTLAGHEFNIASPKQLAAVLFDELGLRKVKKTQTGQSTDIGVLEELAADHPLPAKAAEHRQLAKLCGTYVDALPMLVHPQTGRIHTSFNQAATATGRLSSSNPNLQNIPVRTAEGKEIRSAFIPGKGFDKLLSCDYSQIELRVLAHFSGDEMLCESFRRNEDIHARVAGEVFGVPLDQVDSGMRRTAKAVNFGVIYGQTAFGLSRQLGIDQKEAQQFIDNYFAKYPSIRQYVESVLADCLAKGYVSTLSGRRRYFGKGTIRPARKGVLNGAERMALNTVIQGTAAELMKQAMVRLRDLDSFEANLLLQIHDELVFEVSSKDAGRLTQYVTEIMLLDQPLRVPLIADAEVTERWR